MAIERIPDRFPDPVKFARTIGGTTPPDAGDIARAVGAPTRYIDSSSLKLATTLSKQTTPLTYGKDGGQSQDSARGTTLNITA